MRAKGLTTYIAPIYHSPDLPDALTVFANPAGTSFAKITDGTSNTIALVEAHPKHAVVWTKPDDLVIDSKAKDPLQGLRGQPNDGFNALFCDGSVRFIKTDIDVKLFQWLLLMNDGNAANLP
jgi:prepilin-type processing-associated H-X9-DG protein